MKKIISALLIILIFIHITPAFAATSSEIQVILNGERVQFDVPPIIINDRTMVPFRAIFEALNMEVEWFENVQTVQASREEQAIRLRIGITEMEIVTPVVSSDGRTIFTPYRTVPLDTPPQIIDNRTLVPLRAIAEATGKDVTWTAGNRTVTIQPPRYPRTLTSIVGEPVATLAQAQAWATDRNAHQRFIDIAEVYWYYGEIFGIRPDVLFAQAAKETAFGRFTGAVLPNMNNWAGIKVRHSVADETHDHETFATPEDGVRAHFNHMAAYVGVPTVGRTHPRFDLVISLNWAGTYVYTERLGGRWAPEATYGYSIVHDFLAGMIANSETPRVKVVYLSPSTQFYNRYTGVDTTEADEMIAIAKIVAEQLESHGIIVVTAEPREGISFRYYLPERAYEARSVGADIYVSLHSNAANGRATGTEIFFHPRMANSIALAQYIYDEVNAITISEGRGLRDGIERNLMEIRLPTMPVVLLEVDFHDVEETAIWITENHEQIATAVTTGILRFFNMYPIGNS